MEITPAALTKYRDTAHRRAREDDARRDALRQRAWAVAAAAAGVLRDEFGASDVFAFGSLARGGPFDEHSDVDIAARGVAEEAYFRAVARLLALDPQIPVDLVRIEDASPTFREAIEAEASPL